MNGSIKKYMEEFFCFNGCHNSNPNWEKTNPGTIIKHRILFKDDIIIETNRLYYYCKDCGEIILMLKDDEELTDFILFLR